MGDGLPRLQEPSTERAPNYLFYAAKAAAGIHKGYAGASTQLAENNLRDESCESCDALGSPPCSSAERLFPKSKDEQERVVRRITYGVIFSGQVIFDDRKKL